MVLDFDQFMVKKEHKGPLAFVFLLNNELPHLNKPEHWLHNLREPCFVVRLNEEEFNILDIGKHPKLIFFKQGKERQYLTGLPKLAQMNEIFRSLK
jgi:hypothetical protein